ncbi:acyl-CoA dehydrogenase family protein [Aquisphaera insulae]|uniref:acyl-CoA dehydrogenase family protein n=1 Tax=Aquisphaera insulae TaxID=2712864 RepID=UPI00202E7380|nr:acyl-CoA dehydrogenase family protein [Aquisphaera insulae]
MMSNSETVAPAWTVPDPDAAGIENLIGRLSEHDADVDMAGTWSEPLWRLLLEAGATLWSLPTEQGGQGLARPLMIQRFAQVASGSLTAAFIMSQHEAAVKRLAAAGDRPAARRWLDRIRAKEAFATVGISQLTTSRRLGAQALTAIETSPGQYLLKGAMPWVTGAERADLFVTGALMEDGRQLLIALPADRAGVTVRPSFELASLQASCTAEVTLGEVQVDDSDLLTDPNAEISSQPGAVGTAGLETSALALGQAQAAVAALRQLSAAKTELLLPSARFEARWSECFGSLLACARGDLNSCDPLELREQSNDLVCRSTQAFLLARKGSGFVRSEPAQRWARQALFFLVWSCPPSLVQEAIGNLAGA